MTTEDQHDISPQPPSLCPKIDRAQALATDLADEDYAEEHDDFYRELDSLLEDIRARITDLRSWGQEWKDLALEHADTLQSTAKHNRASEWKDWKTQRPPNAPGRYRFRTSVPVTVLDMELQPEWTEELQSCGMGLGLPEYWPLSPCYWDGYNRYMTQPIQWREVFPSDPEGITWHGLDLLPCPFTGRAPSVTHYGGRAPWHVEWLTIESHLLKSVGWQSARALVEAWNTRA